MDLTVSTEIKIVVCSRANAVSELLRINLSPCSTEFANIAPLLPAILFMRNRKPRLKSQPVATHTEKKMDLMNM
jgi:hypothetical protein